jgi:hypothetical protein
MELLINNEVEKMWKERALRNMKQRLVYLSEVNE